jgi:hypothetical protein
LTIPDPGVCPPVCGLHLPLMHQSRCREA